MANVLHLFRALQRRLPMEEVAEVRALEDSGLEGCAHARTGSPRQVLLVDSETLELMELPPGIIRENITTRGINVNGLETGQRLQVGAAQLEVSMVCTPCDMLEKIRPGLRRELRGRRGMLCRVVAGGLIREGDRIERIA
jgi:MOSC domain-containing protein YiiM